VNYGTGDIPYAVAVGDFDGDHKLDLVVVNSGANTVSAVMGNGDGTFQTRVDYPAGLNPNAVVAGDFNGDGISDLAVATSNCPSFPACGPGTISIMLGNGDGSFQNPQHYSTGTNTDPYELAVGDFNGDHKLDLAVVNYATNTASIFLGAGDGSFPSHVDYPVGSEPTSVAVGDLNGDGKMDLVVANFHGNSASVLLGNGNGTFQSAVTYNTGNGPIAAAVADFNGDHKLDLVVVNETDNNASVFLGNGDGTFRAPVAYSTGVGGNPLSVTVGDFNGDGKLDLAVADFHTQQVSVLLGNGDGTFQTVKAYPTGANPSSVVMGDFNNDGRLDLALTSTPLGSSAGNLVSLLRGKGDGTFGPPVLFATGSQAYSAALGDYNGDGAMDLAVANGVSNTVSVLLNGTGVQMNLASSANPSGYEQSITLTGTVAASVSGANSPGGSVSFFDGTVKLGSGAINSNGVATLSISTLAIGTHSITAVYSGDPNFSPRTSAVLSQIVRRGNSSTALSATSGAAVLTLTATVTGAAGLAATGSVSFTEGTTQLGNSNLNGSGIATLSLSTLTAGIHSVSANYAGDTNFGASISTSIDVSTGFTLSASALSPSSVAAGQSASSTITIAPLNGFSPAGVSFTCSISPEATHGPSCSAGNITMANGSGTATLTVATVANTAATAPHLAARRPGTTLALAFLLIPIMLVSTAGLGKQDRKRLLTLCLAFLVIGGCLVESACGGGGGSGGSNPPPSGGTPAGSYTVTLTGSASGVQQKATATLTVQ
jgi:Bacterial Ig-like domain (group 3)/FG-GAP-like repeat